MAPYRSSPLSNYIREIINPSPSMAVCSSRWEVVADYPVLSEEGRLSARGALGGEGLLNSGQQMVGALSPPKRRRRGRIFTASEPCSAHCGSHAKSLSRC